MNRTESTKCWRNFLNELGGSNERVSIIVAVAEMDSRLTSVLRASLLPVGKNDDDDSLFGSDRPLSSFSARIHLAYRLGLIDDSFARALHLIRKMRNEFARNNAWVHLDTVLADSLSPRGTSGEQRQRLWRERGISCVRATLLSPVHCRCRCSSLRGRRGSQIPQNEDSVKMHPQCLVL